MTLERSIYIEAPVDKVFDFYKDPRKAWSAGPDQMVKRGQLTDVKITEDGVGTYYSWTVSLLPGLRLEGFDVLTECVPNQRITDRSSRSFVGTWTATFEPEGSGTRVTQWRLPMSSRVLRPVDRLMDRFREALIRESLEKMKAELEKTTARAAEPVTPGQHTAP